MNHRFIFFSLFLAGVLSLPLLSRAYDLSLTESLSGHILLQVEQHGEAWYVRSTDDKRYYMKDGDAAYTMMRLFSLGITDEDLAKIPSVNDTTEMINSSSICESNTFAGALSGEILLQVEQHGEAWYVYPERCRIIYLKNGAAAYDIMRFLSLGITDNDLGRVEPGVLASNSMLPSFSEYVVEEGTKPDVPFGNGRGVEIIGDTILTMHAEAGEMRMVRHFIDEEGVTIQDYSVPSTFDQKNDSPHTIAEDGGVVLISWTEAEQIRSAFSYDGGLTWTEPSTLVGDSSGPRLPTSCMWHDDADELHAMIGWIKPHNEDEDGGPLYISEYENESWSDPQRVGSLELASSPSLTCSGVSQSVVMRHEETDNIYLYFSQRTDAQTWPEPRKLFVGADPHMASCGDDIWIEYHHIGAYLTHSPDNGETWETILLDKAGKFGSIACEKNYVVVQWGAYTSTAAANSGSKDGDERTVGAQISVDAGISWIPWDPAGGEFNQSVASVDIEEGEIVIYWRAPDRVRVRRYIP